jgi:hypothetical protein
MNNNRLTTILGLIAGTSELIAQSGALGPKSIYASGAGAIALSLLGWLVAGRQPAPPVQ